MKTDAPFRYSPFDRNPVCILGVPFDPLGVHDAVAKLHEAALCGRRCFISTANLNFLVTAQNDARFRETLLKSDLCLVDGAPIVWIAKLLGLPLHERAPGASVFDALLASSQSTRVFFFGGPDGVAKMAHERINSLKGSVVSVGYLSPGYGTVDELSSNAVVDEINAANADFVVVALGAGKGQAWIDACGKRLTAPIISHLGAVVNFSAGTVKRAPELMQRLGFEWLWRIKEEPHLAGRYWRDAKSIARLFVSHLLPLWLTREAFSKSVQGLQTDSWVSAHHVHVVLNGSCTAHNLARLRAAFAEASASSLDIQVDMGKVGELDAMGAGCLLQLYGHQLNSFLGLQLRGLSPALAHRLRLFGGDYLLDEESILVPRRSNRHHSFGHAGSVDSAVANLQMAA